MIAILLGCALYKYQHLKYWYQYFKVLRSEPYYSPVLNSLLTKTVSCGSFNTDTSFIKIGVCYQ